ncbi:MAG: N-acetylmuramoyl-L-alanine amidase [Polyangiaceae bacterium]
MNCRRRLLRGLTVFQLGLVLTACAAVEPLEERADGPRHETQAEATTMESFFQSAAAEYDVPVELLKAVAWVETGAAMVVGEEEFAGRAAAFGVMALRSPQLNWGAERAGVSDEDAKFDLVSNIRAAAAVMSGHAETLGIDRADLADWPEVLTTYAGIDEREARVHYVHDQVYGLLRKGLATEVLSIAPRDVSPNYPNLSAHLATAPDYDQAVWRPSPNYSSRSAGSAGKPQMVIIHSCEGSYAGCWGWLKNPSAKVSAHYVVREDGGQITQLVRETKKAWHIGATYKCSLNGNKHCDLSGYGSNNFTLGIEHAGYASQSKWDEGLLKASARLTCDMTKYWKIEADSYHVVGHGQLQPYNRVDPGPNWPWSHYLDLVDDYCGGGPIENPPPPEEEPENNDPGDPPSGPLSIVVDSNKAYNGSNASFSRSGAWTASKNVSGYFNTGYFWRSTGSTADAARFDAYLPTNATVTIEAWWAAGSDRSAKAPFVIHDSTNAQLDVVHVDQRKSGGKWVTLGTYALTKGWTKVSLSRWTTPGDVVVADAVRFREAP